MTSNGEKERWTDRWPVKIMVWALVLCAGMLVSGATWIVKSAVATESGQVRQDEEIKALQARQEQETKAREVQQVEVMKRLDEIRDDVKELRKK